MVWNTRSCGLRRPVTQSDTTGSPPPCPARTSDTFPAPGLETRRFPSGVTAMNRAPGTRAYTAIAKPPGIVSERGTSNGALRIEAGTLTPTVDVAPEGSWPAVPCGPPPSVGTAAGSGRAGHRQGGEEGEACAPHPERLRPSPGGAKPGRRRLDRCLVLPLGGEPLDVGEDAGPRGHRRPAAPARRGRWGW